MNTKKKELLKRKIRIKHGCNGQCNRCTNSEILIDKMDEANIPVGYWALTMKNFVGSNKLRELVEEYTKNINEKYELGSSVCFAGNQGTGKTMSSICIIKTAIKHKYSAYYIAASDVLSELTNRNNYELRHKLRTVDFLIIDELDSRFFTSEATKELFSSIYENIFRSRCQNLLPTIICTNETEGILGVFSGAGVQSIDSLNKQYLKTYPIIGKDFRGNV